MHNLFVALFFLLSGLACHKDDQAPGLPAVTSSGANTFGCLIDGKPWVAGLGPEVLDAMLRKIEAGYDETGTGLFYQHSWRLRANLIRDTTYDSFGITAWRLDKPGRLDYYEHRVRVQILFGNRQQIRAVYELDTMLPYQIIITKLDTVRNVSSGVFEFYAVSDDKADTLHITRGRFDAGYVPE